MAEDKLITALEAQELWEQSLVVEPEAEAPYEEEFGYWDEEVVRQEPLASPFKAFEALLSKTKAQALAKEALAEAAKRKAADAALWQSGGLWWQGALRLLRLKGGAEWITTLTLEEWENRQVSKTRGLKGSPKLFKQLVDAGCPAKSVELLLSGTKKAKAVAHVADFDVRYIKDQGNSRHFNSCQATFNNTNSSYGQIDGDIISYGVSLFLWVIGEAMVDGNPNGWEARAKLRLLTTREVSNNELIDLLDAGRGDEIVAGLYIDRPYGDYTALASGLNDLNTWWQNWCIDAGVKSAPPIYIAPVWNREDGAGNDFEEVYPGNCKPMFSPSSENGYQDTMTRKQGPYTFMKKAKSGVLVGAYEARKKEGGARKVSTKDVVFNPQNFSFRCEEPKFSARVPLSAEQKKAATCLALLFGGYDKGSLQVDRWNLSVTKKGYTVQISEGMSLWDCNVMIQDGQFSRTLVQRRYDGVCVNFTAPELGFEEAVELPYGWESGAMVVNRDIPSLGFACAQNIPYKLTKDGLEVTTDCAGFMNAEDISQRLQLQMRGVKLTAKYNGLFCGKDWNLTFYDNLSPEMSSGSARLVVSKNLLYVSSSGDGYLAAVGIPYRISKGGLTVLNEMPEEGFMPAVSLSKKPRA